MSKRNDKEGPAERSTRRVQRPAVRAIGRIMNDLEDLGPREMNYLAGVFLERARDVEEAADPTAPAQDAGSDEPSPVN